MGKTRLGLELCRHMAERHWLAGIYRPRGEAAVNALASEPLPRLVVVDYAEDDPVAVHRLVERLSEKLPLRVHRIRVLLLVRRHAPSGDARRIFAGNQDDAAHLIDERQPISLSSPTSDGPVRSGLRLVERRRLFQAAVEAFAARAGQPGPTIEIPDLDTETYNSPLFVTAAAFLALDGDGANSTEFSSSDELLDRILEHEQKTHWRSCPEPDPEIQRRVVAIATLFGADDEAEMAGHLETVVGLDGADSRAQRHRLALWLHRLYSGERWVNPLEPDLLGEALVLQHVDPRLLNRAFELGAVASGTRAITVLTRLAATDERLRGLVGSHLEMHLACLFDVAVQQEASTSIWGQRGLLAEALTALLDVTGLWSPPWPQSPTAVGPACLTLALQFDRHAVTAFKRLAAIEPGRFSADLAAALNALGVDLGSSGHPDEALAAMIDAAGIRRDLAAIDPKAIIELSMSLNNLAVRHGALGHSADALEAIEEAVKIRRDLARDDPAEFLPRLARSLSNYSQRLAAIGGRSNDALDAIEEAVAIRVALEEAEPGRHLADLATSLGGLSGRLSESGRSGEALATMERVVGIRRNLATAQPSTYLPNLATSLSSLSERFRDLGRSSEALAAIDEAVKIRRHLFANRPNIYRVRLVSALTLLADSLEATHNPQDRVKAGVVRAEALSLTRRDGPTEEYERSMNSYPAVDRAG
jgi:tetratricopeptide (TPR) repeat protein